MKTSNWFASMAGAALIAAAFTTTACGEQAQEAPAAPAETPAAETPAPAPAPAAEAPAQVAEAPAQVAEAPAAEAPAAEEPAPADAPAAEAPAAPPAGGVVLGAGEYGDLPPGDAARGKRVFAQCMACHVVAEGQNRVGPSLYNIVDRPAGQVAGFNYSPALKKLAEQGLVWTEENLYAYLHAPAKYVPGGRMAFAGIKNDQQVADVIAYMRNPN